MNDTEKLIKDYIQRFKPNEFKVFERFRRSRENRSVLKQEEIRLDTDKDKEIFYKSLYEVDYLDYSYSFVFYHDNSYFMFETDDGTRDIFFQYLHAPHLSAKDMSYYMDYLRKGSASERKDEIFEAIEKLIK